MLGINRSIGAAALLGSLFTQALGQGIYTCVDAKGRRLTADRPIPECNDREQSELNRSGTVLRRIPPTLTAAERAAEEDKARKAVEERNRLADEKKRERALISRYPDKAAHDKERAAALGKVDEVIATAAKHGSELAAQRKRLEGEIEFYRNDPSKLPPKVKRQIEENEQAMATHKRFLADQDGEKKRVNARFDEELGKLRQLWAVLGTASPPGPAPAPAATPSAAAATTRR